MFKKWNYFKCKFPLFECTSTTYQLKFKLKIKMAKLVLTCSSFFSGAVFQFCCIYELFFVHFTERKSPFAQNITKNFKSTRQETKVCLDFSAKKIIWRKNALSTPRFAFVRIQNILREEKNQNKKIVRIYAKYNERTSSLICENNQQILIEQNGVINEMQILLHALANIYTRYIKYCGRQFDATPHRVAPFSFIHIAVNNKNIISIITTHR